MFPGAVSACDKQVTFTPIPQEPGYAMFLAPVMPQVSKILPIEDAEMYRINNDRKNCSLESIGDMPEVGYIDFKDCRHCHQVAGFSCSACWTFYCSKNCQRQNWSTHLFICRIPNRPHVADYLSLSIKRINKAMVFGDEESISKSISELFADDLLCCTLGFSNCSSITETKLLVQLYHSVISSCRTPMKDLQEALQAGDLRGYLCRFCEEYISKTARGTQSYCMFWFLALVKRPNFSILDPKNMGYEIWDAAIARSLSLLGLKTRLKEGEKLDFAQNQVFNLFVNIQPFIGWLPDVYSSIWMEFGFCYCKTYRQRKELADKYIALASSKASFDDIVAAYKSWTMADLMTAQDIDLTDLKSQGITLRKPSVSEDTVFRLMAGVEHALSGQYCMCFRMNQGRSCHSGFETHLDLQSDICYGFHLSSSWERWQLLNFYKTMFKLPGFDPREMAETK
ncbi:hypothetical protein N7495_002863 [Penicillium taxi]|uniref:uncharacterized protein n=1 Tax=Penicillium taxi TaxID=168475 RepID=UPI00254570E0|nr:uncharacterized protein N7495_002863 [Penicillium taxi]KAJ5902335.1 hypothetical protein N7495_002863 [Penicillium taxi]